jgi:hypothetical protein
MLKKLVRKGAPVLIFYEHTVGELEWAQILAPEMQEVEGVEAGTRLAVARHEAVEVGEPRLTMRDGLAVENEVAREGAKRRRDPDELGRPVAALPSPKLHAVALLAAEQPVKPSCFSSWDPVRAGRDNRRENRLRRRDQAGRSAPRPGERGTHQHRRDLAGTLRAGQCGGLAQLTPAP